LVREGTDWKKPTGHYGHVGGQLFGGKKRGSGRDWSIRIGGLERKVNFRDDMVVGEGGAGQESNEEIVRGSRSKTGKGGEEVVQEGLDRRQMKREGKEGKAAVVNV